MTSIARVAAVVLVAAMASPAAAAPGLFELGVLTEPNQIWFESEANDVSADGSVVVGVGKSKHAEETYTRNQAFRFEDGILRGLAPLVPRHDDSAAYGVSDDGAIVVGTVYTETFGSTQGGFLWDEADQVGILPDVPGGPIWSSASGVSGDGSVVVGHSPDSLNDHAVRWDAGAPLLLDTGTGWSYANAVDADGTTAVGFRQPRIPMRWDGAVGQPLPIPAGMLEATPEGISSDGAVIVGWSRIGVGTEQATRWDESGAVLLGTLPGDATSRLLDASGSGSLMVGYSRDASGARRAVVWDALSGMRSLRDVLEDDYGFDLTGWVLEEARGISDDGMVIVGVGVNPGNLRRAFLAKLGGNGAPACSNGSDDDGDGTIDLVDPGCASALDLSEYSHVARCDDGLDNDSDGDVDFPADPGCPSLAASLEGPACDDDLDNDRDSRVDWDGGSGGAEPDPQCQGNPLRTGEGGGRCGLGFEAGFAIAVWWALRARKRPCH